VTHQEGGPLPGQLAFEFMADDQGERPQLGNETTIRSRAGSADGIKEAPDVRSTRRGQN
jgi:hypothetical protein